MAGEVFSSLTTSINPYAMNASSRGGVAIDRIVLHHNATVNKNVAMNTWLTTSGTGTSAHYEITDTEIIGCVGEQYAAHHCGGTGGYDVPKMANPNTRSIGLENVNSAGAPSWAVSEATHINCARLVADICTRYGIPCDRQHVLKHSEVTATACPGGLDADKVVRYAQEILKGKNLVNVPESKQEEIEEDEEMGVTEFAFAYNGAIFYVVGNSMSVMHSEAEWATLRAMYSATHNEKQIEVRDWTKNEASALSYFGICSYGKDKEFQNSVTKGFETILKELK